MRSVNTFPFRLLIHFRQDSALILKHPSAPEAPKITGYKVITLSWCAVNSQHFDVSKIISFSISSTPAAAEKGAGHSGRTVEGRTRALDLWPGARQSVCGSVRAFKANSAGLCVSSVPSRLQTALFPTVCRAARPAKTAHKLSNGGNLAGSHVSQSNQDTPAEGEDW